MAPRRDAKCLATATLMTTLLAIAGCAGSGEPTLTKPPASPTPSAATAPSTGDRCGPALERMTATYVIRTRPAGDNLHLWVELFISSRLPRLVGGDTYGALLTEPRPVGEVKSLVWGSSSADSLQVPPHARRYRHHIGDYVGQPLLVTATAKVARVGMLTMLNWCEVPARIRAPHGLVTGHTQGDWQLAPDVGERIAVEIMRKG
jgi:hypothetical protein